MFLQISKVQKDGNIRYVTCTGTSEDQDGAGEIMDYETTKSLMGAYMTRGTVREMHQPIAAGKAVSYAALDAEKRIVVTAKVVDPTCVMKIDEGVLQGMSIRGPIASQEGRRIKLASITEFSLVDRGENPRTNDLQVVKFALSPGGVPEAEKALAYGPTTAGFAAGTLYCVMRTSDGIAALGDAYKYLAAFAEQTGKVPETMKAMYEIIQRLTGLVGPMAQDDITLLLDSVSSEVILQLKDAPEVTEALKVLRDKLAGLQTRLGTGGSMADGTTAGTTGATGSTTDKGGTPPSTTAETGDKPSLTKAYMEKVQAAMKAGKHDEAAQMIEEAMKADAPASTGATSAATTAAKSEEIKPEDVIKLAVAASLEAVKAAGLPQPTKGMTRDVAPDATGAVARPADGKPVQTSTEDKITEAVKAMQSGNSIEVAKLILTGEAGRSGMVLPGPRV